MNHMIFLLQFLLGGAVDMNSIVSLKQLILSALLYAGAALSMYFLFLLTLDGICLVIVGGWLLSFQYG